MASPPPPSHTANLCTLNRSRAVELPIDPTRPYTPFPTPSGSASNTPPPAPPSTRLPSPSGSEHSPLGIPVRETAHATHHGYIADIAARPALELSAMTATFHWRALALVRRAVAFHMGGPLQKGDGDAERSRKRKRGGGAAAAAAAATPMREKAAGFVDGEKDVVDGQGGRVTIAPAQLLRLKAVVNCLTVERVLGTMTWIEDHEIERVATGLETSSLRAHQQWCGSCTRVFFVTAGQDGIIPQEAMAKNPVGIHDCCHIVCKNCVIKWLYDVTVKGVTGTQPCCVRMLGLDE